MGFGVKFGSGRSISGGNRESWLNPLGTHPENPKKVRENPKIMRKTSIPVDFGGGNEGKMTPNWGGKSPLKDPSEKGG